MTKPRTPDPRHEASAAGLPLRVAMMDLDRRKRARKLRRDGYGPDEIAVRLGATAEEVVAALGAMRGRRDPVEANHLNLSCTRTTGEYLRSLAYPGEATWQTMDRLAAVLRAVMPSQQQSAPPQRERSDTRAASGLSAALTVLIALTAPAIAEPCVTLSARAAHEVADNGLRYEHGITAHASR